MGGECSHHCAILVALTHYCSDDGRITVSSFVCRLYLGSAVVRAVALHHYGLVCRKPEVTSWRIEFGFQKTIQSELCEDLQIYLFIYLFIYLKCIFILQHIKVEDTPNCVFWDFDIKFVFLCV